MYLFYLFYLFILFLFFLITIAVSYNEMKYI